MADNSSPMQNIRRELEYLASYFFALIRQWASLVTGGIVIALLTVYERYRDHSIPASFYWSVSFFLFVVAGYQSWRKYHVRLVPKMQVTEHRIQHSPTLIENGRGESIWIQLVVKATTDADVTGCRGHLIRIDHRHTNLEGADWTATDANETLPLGWSLNSDGYSSITLHAGVPKNLNILSMEPHQHPVPTVHPLPLRYQSLMTHPGAFRFVVRITADNAQPLDTIVEIEPKGGNEWRYPRVEVQHLPAKGL